MQKIHKSQVVGLPPHAHLQYLAGVPRVYFQYAYTIDGKKYTERDYLGSVDTLTLEFIPNAYYMREKPVFENRPIHRYKNEKKRIREIERRNKELLARKSEILKNHEAKASETKADEFKAEETIARQTAPNKAKVEDAPPNGPKAESAVPNGLKNEAAKTENGSIPVAISGKAFYPEEPADVLLPNETKQVGASAIAIAILLETGMIEDLYRHVLHNMDDVIKLVNLAVHAAITAMATYNAGINSCTQLYIGGNCLTSPRASEFYQRIGADQSVSKKISLARLKRVGRSGLVALDGTKIPCNSKNIAIAAVGKDKKGGFSKQISFSLLAHIPTGQAVGYEYCAGNIPDISLIDHYLNQWENIGIKDTDVTFAMDRGLYSKETVVKLSEGGIKFIIGMKTNVKVVSDAIRDRNYEFYEPTALLDKADCYGVKFPWKLGLKEPADNVNVYIYRSPVKEMENSRNLKEKLLDFKRQWDSGNYDFGNNLLSLCNNPAEGKKLSINWKAYNQECYLHGYFAMVSNVEGLNLENALEDYSGRNDVEVLFEIMYKNLLKTTRVHSLAALSGLLLSVFVALNILGVIRPLRNRRLPKSWLGKKPDAMIKSRLGLAETIWIFNTISLYRTSDGKLGLIGDTKKLKDLAAAIGMEGLFDSPERVARLFSPSYLKRVIGVE